MRLEEFSIEPVPNPFIIPGGRFLELYYWDSYWIIAGLLICGMDQTAKGMIENMFWLIDKYGFIPNGGRIYYNRRSQPPLLTAMVAKYFQYTNDHIWLQKNIKKLDKELSFWLKYRSIEVGKYTLSHYRAQAAGPRPERYREDYLTAGDQDRIYIELKSGAESGWDYSSRWFYGNNRKTKLKDLRVIPIIPVDLNAFYCGAAGILSQLYNVLGNDNKAFQWRQVEEEFRNAIYEVLWDEEDGIWYDYDVVEEQLRKFYFASNVTPLWTQSIHRSQNLKIVGRRVAEYLIYVGATGYPGGVPSSLVYSNEQWDWPNAWAPFQNINAKGLDNSGSFFS